VDAFSYRLGDTGVVLNPNDTSVLPFVDITKVSGLDTPELRSTERDHEGVDGGFLDAEFEKMRTIVLEGQVIGHVDFLETYLDTLKGNWAARRASIPFYFAHPGVAERLVYVKPLGCRYDVDAARRLGTADIQFLCQAEDPRIYDSALQTVQVSQGLPITTGTSYSLGYPFGFGAVVSPEGSTVINGGNRPTPAIITLTGPVTNPVIYNDTYGNEMAFEIVVASGETLVIDLGYRTVKLNGSVSRRSALIEPDWFMLEPGENFLRYRASTGGAAPATVAFRNAWR
jgi:hypothetical protein